MVLDYLGMPRSETELANQLQTTPFGTPGSRLLQLSDQQLHVSYEQLTLSLLQSHLLRQNPVIVLVRTVFPDYWQEDTAHAIVVVGQDDEHILIDDPAFNDAPQLASFNGFLAAWGEFNFLASVIIKR
jgi:ABC-type bacteriocin/lantibiotic exporter with double-glycine peptidase domain